MTTGDQASHETAVVVSTPSTAVGPVAEQRAAIAQRVESFGLWREGLKQFVTEHLHESEYKSSGYPAAGKTHDYYRATPKSGYALTRPGAEKVAQFLVMVRGATATTRLHEAEDYVSVTCMVQLLDAATGTVRGTGEASATSAEDGFAKLKGSKYKGDFRGAVNDIQARASKRAFVQAVTVAAGMGELFAEMLVDRQAAAVQRSKLRSRDPQGLPIYLEGGEHAGKRIDAAPTTYLVAFLQRLNDSPHSAPELVTKIEQVLAAREDRAT